MAREGTVHGIDDKDTEGEDMHHEHGHEHEWDVAHPEDGMLAVDPGEQASRVEEEGVYDDEDDVGDAVAIEILRTEVEPAWIHVHHCNDST